jgi:hypothetical protein
VVGAVEGGRGGRGWLGDWMVCAHVINVVVNVLDDLAVVLVRGQVMIELNHDAVVVKAAQACDEAGRDGRRWDGVGWG